MPKKFVEVEIIGDPALFEELTGVMLQLGFEGFWEDGNRLRTYMTMESWSIGLLEELIRDSDRVAAVHNALPPSIQTRKIKEQNWNAEWEKTIQPIQVTKRIVIKPSWRKYTPSSNQIVLTIDPKMSFGTGYHETTRMILKLIEKHCKAGMSVLDVGTGTGVLAIAAVKLGAEKSVGVDSDEWSYDNARENVQLNDAQDQVQIMRGDISVVKEQRFDMVVANIQRNVLLEILADMRARLAPDGLLLLSGLLLEDESPMIDALHGSGFRMIEELIENEWIALAARRADSSPDIKRRDQNDST
jgi:ribosomal protein L11 methyltransferase